MKLKKWLLATAGLCGLVAAGPVSAQDSDRPEVFIYGLGGGITSLRHFDPAPDAKFKTGYSVGGGLGVQLNRYVAVRGNLLFVRSRAIDPDLDQPGLHNSWFNRYIYSGELEVGYPIESVTPYLIAGGGAITFDNRTDPAAENFTRGFGKAGLGLRYRLPNTPVSLFVQGTQIVYEMDRFGSNRTLLDTTWTGGVRLHLGGI